MKTDVGAFWYGNLTYLKNQCLEPEDYWLLMLGSLPVMSRLRAHCPFLGSRVEEAERMQERQCRRTLG